LEKFGIKKAPVKEDKKETKITAAQKKEDKETADKKVDQI